MTRTQFNNSLGQHTRSSRKKPSEPTSCIAVFCNNIPLGYISYCNSVKGKITLSKSKSTAKKYTSSQLHLLNNDINYCSCMNPNWILRVL